MHFHGVLKHQDVCTFLLMLIIYQNPDFVYPNLYLIIMFIDCKWVDTRWQWSFNMLQCTDYGG